MGSGASNDFDDTAGQPQASLPLSDAESAHCEVNGFPATLHEGRQGKHIEGHPNYQEGKSIVTVSMARMAELVVQFAGLGVPAGPQKERVDFGETIGVRVSGYTGERLSTTRGTIHYSKTGCHVVPADPRKR